MGGGEAGRPATAKAKSNGPWEYRLRKYLLLLATLVATVTYGAAFNPPGGVWQDAAGKHIAGDPIIRETRYGRYLAFFYSNAAAFACSLVVIVLVLILAVLHERNERRGGSTSLTAPLRILRFVMVLDLLSLLGAYAAGTFRDKLTAIYSLVLLALVAAYLVVRIKLAWRQKDRKEESPLERLRKVLMLLATFAVSVTYVAGLSAPGGFWDHAVDAGVAHRPGDAVLKGGRHDKRLKAFFICNTTAFVASLLVIVILLEKKLCLSNSVKSPELYVFIAVMLIGLVGAYSAGSCRHIDTTIYVNSLIGAVIAFVLLQVAVIKFREKAIENSSLRDWEPLKRIKRWLVQTRNLCLGNKNEDTRGTGTTNGSAGQSQLLLEKARSLVLLLATLAAAITYQAGLNPPGGLWQDGGAGYMAGDPILLTTNPRRYKAFYYCNSVAFVASLVAIMLVRMRTLHHHHALEAAMILDLFGLIGAYAAGSCRDVTTSIYAMALAGAVLVYVVLHIVFFTLDHNDGSTRGARDEASLKEEEDADRLLEKRRKRLLLFAILAATITYQAGLTPPSGFLLKPDPSTRHLAGDPVLLNNYPRRYTAFFYCNSVSFMLSIALIILLVNPNLYRPAIRSNAVSICTAAGMVGIMGAYAAGCTQHLKTSYYIFGLAVFVLSVVVAAVVYLTIHERNQRREKASAISDIESPREADGTSTQGAAAAAAAAAQASTQAAAAAAAAAQASTEAAAAAAAAQASTEGAVAAAAATAAAQAFTEAAAAAAAAAQASTTAAAAAAAAQASTVAAAAQTSNVPNGTAAAEDEDDELHAKRKYLMLLGILVASVTYQAGLAPPGGVWQSNEGGYAAGDPVMHDNRRHRYLAFYYSNSISFVASIVVVVLLVPPPSKHKNWWLGVMKTTIGLDLLALLVAYAAGSSRSWKTAGNVTALVIAVLGYFVIHVVLSCCARRGSIWPFRASSGGGENTAPTN